jgi:DNA polymerase-3 subunit delta
MRIKYAQLEQQLAQTKMPVFLITGDEPLQVLEAADRIRAWAKQKGFAEREVFNVDGSFDWNIFTASSQTMSLFSSRKVLDLRLPAAKLKEDGASALVDYLRSPTPDNVLLVTAPKLDSAAQKSAWFTALDKVGVVVQIWPIDAEALPSWIMRRGKQKGIVLHPEAAQLLAEHVEGNLLAAAQEIDKLCLTSTSDIDAKRVADAVAESSQFDVYDLVDAALTAKKERVVRIIHGLRDGDTEPIMVLWALSRELRVICECAYAKKNGESIQRVFQQERVFDKHQPIVQVAVSARSIGQWRRMLSRAAHVDRVAKGMASGNVWDELLKLCLSMSGSRLFRVEA